LQENTSSLRPLYRRTWLVVLAAVAAACMLLLVVLPFGISYGLQQWLANNGGEAVQLEDVDFNIFTGRASVTDLNVLVDGQSRLLIPRLELDVDWLPVLSRRIDARAVTLEGVEINIVQGADGSLRVGGISLPAGEEQSEETGGEVWGFGLEQLEIINTTVTYQSPDLKLVTHFVNLELGHLATWKTDPASLILNATVNDAPILLEGELPPLSGGFGFAGKLSVTALQLHPFATLAATAIDGLVGELKISSELDVLFSPDNLLTLAHTGEFGLNGLALQQAGRQLSYKDVLWAGELKLETAIDSGSIELALQGEMTGKGLVVADEDLQVSYASQHWTGALAVNTAGGGAATAVNLQGKLGGNKLAVLIPSEQFSIYHGDFLWDGVVDVAAGEETSLAVAGSLRIDKLGADTAEHKISLANVQNVTVDELQLLANGDISLTGLAINDAVFAQSATDDQEAGKEDKQGKEGSVLSAGRISADSIKVTEGNQVAIGSIEWRDVVSFIQRESNGEWRPVRVVDTLPFTTAQQEQQQAQPVEQEKPAGETAADELAGRVRVGEIRITGDSAIILDDQTVKPPFKMRLTVTEGVIENIDNGNPEQDSTIDFKGYISKHSLITVKGTLQPFAARPTLNLVNHVDGISLPQLTPYTVEALGYALDSGQLEADSTLKINKGVVDSQNKLVIRGLEISPVDNESREKLDGSLTVSLDTALGMLRDKNNTIKLDLPVKGDIDSPDFDISNVINTAVGKAITQGSMTYLKFALQPYGALITVAELAGEAATRVRLQPVGFAAGEVEPKAEVDGYLEKVAGILKDRPEVNIKICGLAVAADRVAMGGVAEDSKAKSEASGKAAVAVSDQQLLELAKQRAAFVKDRLVIKYGVTAGRLVACTPEIDGSEDDDNLARVELLI